MQHFDQNKIDLFLKDELSAQEKEKFIQAIKNTPSLNEEILIQQELVKHLNHLGDLNLKTMVKEVHQEAVSQKKRNNNPYFKVLLAIIGLSLLILAYFLMNQVPKHEKLYQAYYQSYDKLSFTTRSSKTIDEQTMLAADFYAEKDYRQALPLFKNIMANSPSNSKVCMATGICEMELKRFQAALATFDKLIQKNDRLYYYQAVWYSALIHLHENKKEKCIANLNILAEQPDAIFHKEAKELLRKME